MQERNEMSNASVCSQMFLDGCACSQAILAVFGPALGLPRDAALKIASGFAGGMRMGETCGAVTGGFMVLGLRHAGDDSDTREGRTRVYERLADFTQRFKERNGSLVCRELLGCDVSTPEGLKAAEAGELFRKICPKLVEESARILDEMASQ